MKLEYMELEWRGFMILMNSVHRSHKGRDLSKNKINLRMNYLIGNSAKLTVSMWSISLRSL